MKCANCGAEIAEGNAFCTNCGTPAVIDVAGVADAVNVAEAAGVADAAAESVADAANADPIGSLGNSLENAVQANEEAMKPIEERTNAAFQAAQQTAQEAANAVDQTFGAEASPYADAGYVPASGNAPEAPAGFQAPGAGVGAAVVAGAGVAAGTGAVDPAASSTPFYQKDVSPNAHYSSARTYEADAYGRDTGQPGYREPAYTSNFGGGQTAQGEQAAQQQQTWQPVAEAPSTTTTRAYAMVLYLAGLIGLIIALVMRDKDDAFLTHHLNNVVVITIGAVIGAMLSVIFIGTLLLLYLFVMTIMGIVSAYNGDMRELPLIGKIHIVK